METAFLIVYWAFDKWARAVSFVAFALMEVVDWVLRYKETAHGDDGVVR